MCVSNSENNPKQHEIPLSSTEGDLGTVGRGLLFVVFLGLLTAGAPLVAGAGSGPGLRYLQRVGSVVVARGLGCSTARGIFPDQGSNLCPLHCQVEFYLLHHQGSPIHSFLIRSKQWILL